MTKIGLYSFTSCGTELLSENSVFFELVQPICEHTNSFLNLVLNVNVWRELYDKLCKTSALLRFSLYQVFLTILSTHWWENNTAMKLNAVAPK